MTSGTFALCIFILTRPVDPAAGAAQRLCGIRARLRTAGGGDARGDDIAAPSATVTGGVDAAGGATHIGAETAWLWDGGRTHGSKEVNVPATMVLPLNPAMSQNLDEAVFSLDSLTAVLATLEMTFKKTPDATSNVVKSSATYVDGLPYHPALEVGTPVRRLPDNLKCRICGKDGIGVLDLRHHVGAHVLEAQVCWPQYLYQYRVGTE